MPAPDLSTVPSFYHRYISLVAADSAAAAVSGHLDPLIGLLQGLSEDRWRYAYTPGKWSLAGLVQHMLDTERIFSHRALSIARRDPHPLPGFDENTYADHSAAEGRSGASLLEELAAVAASTRCLFASFNEQQLAATGIANGAPITVNAIAYMLAGHAMHHTSIVRERYLEND